MKPCLGVRFMVALVCLMLGMLPIGNAQNRRQIKVLVESQQSGAQSQEALQGSGSVIIRKETCILPVV